MLVAGCYVPNGDVATPRYFALEFARVGAAAPVPGQVSDTTATISSVQIDLRSPPIGGLDETFVAPVAGRPNAVIVGWPRGTCEARVDLDLSQGGEGHPVFTLKLLDRPDGCDPIGVPRRLILTFERFVNAADFRLEVVH